MLVSRIHFILSLLLWKGRTHASIANQEVVHGTLNNNDYLSPRVNNTRNIKARRKVTYQNLRLERNLGEYIWNQIGADIDGENPYDQFGYSLALSDDKTTLVVGGFRNDGNGAESGHVRIYRLDVSNSWIQLGADIDGKAAGELFGTSVAVSSDGNTVVIGGIMNADGEGLVRVYQLSEGGNWIQVGPDIRGEALGFNFGRSVAISDDGKIIAIGAPMYDSSNGQDSGHVRIFMLSESNSFVKLGKDIIGENGLISFGFSLDLSGDGLSIVIGMAMGGIGSGSVRVYIYNDIVGEWERVGQLIEDGTGVADYFGMSVAMSLKGDRIVVGAPFSDANGKDSGMVIVYELLSGTWRQLGSPIIGEASGDTSGVSVDMSNDGDIIAVGGFMNSGENGMFSGHVRVYAYRQDDWTILGTDLDGEFSMDLFGRSVSISGDGKMVAIGGPLNDGFSGSDSGHVRVFGLEMLSQQPAPFPTSSPSAIPSSIDMPFENGSWIQYGQSLGGYVATRKISMSSDGKYLAISEPNFDCETGPNCGKVEVYNLTDESWIMVGSPILERTANVQFGISQQISNDGRYIVIGGVAGFASVYRIDGNDWSPVGDRIFQENLNDLAGLSVSIGGVDSESLVVAIGAPYNDGSAENSGHVRVYELDIEDKWVQVGSDIDGTNAHDYFGVVVSLSGNGKVVAVSSASFPALSYVKVFLRDSNHEWQQIGDQIQSNDSTDMFGNSISISSNGRILAIGAPFANNGGENSGAVYVYEFNQDSWYQKGKLIDQSAGGGMGFSVSLSDRGTVLVEGSSKTQTASVYRRISDQMWVRVSDRINDAGLVSISGDGTRIAGSGLESVKTFVFDPYTSQPSNVPSIENSQPSLKPTKTNKPTILSSSRPSEEQVVPSAAPQSREPTPIPSDANTTLSSPSFLPSGAPSGNTAAPSQSLVSSNKPSGLSPSLAPSSSSIISSPSTDPTPVPSDANTPLASPSFLPSIAPTSSKSSETPSERTSTSPSVAPSISHHPTNGGSSHPSDVLSPQESPTELPSQDKLTVFSPSLSPSREPTFEPSLTSSPTHLPSTSHQPTALSDRELKFDYWSQIGSSIYGKRNGDRSGFSISLSNNGGCVVIGSPNSDLVEINAGDVRVFQRTGDGQWQQLGDILTGSHSNAKFGTSVDISESCQTIAVGAILQFDDSVSRTGAAGVYRLIEGRWRRIGQEIFGNTFGDNTGQNVALSASGNIVAIASAFYDDLSQNLKNSGKVQIFKYVELEDELFQIGQDLTGNSTGDYFGFSLALSNDGDKIVIGAKGADTIGPNSENGRVQVYQFLGDQWSQVGQLLNGKKQNDQFGYSVSISAKGDKIAVGAPFHDDEDKGTNIGLVQVFRFSENGWIQIDHDILGVDAESLSGWSIDLSGDGTVIVVGSITYDSINSAVDTGLVRVFRSVDQEWVQVGEGLIGDDAMDFFGYDVSLSDDGMTVAASGIDGGGSGVVKIFERLSIQYPSSLPSSSPSENPNTTSRPSSTPTTNPSESGKPTTSQSNLPSFEPSVEPSLYPTIVSGLPSKLPALSVSPSSQISSQQPTTPSSARPSIGSSIYATTAPSRQPSRISNDPSSSPTISHSSFRSDSPTVISASDIPTSTSLRSSNEYWTQLEKLNGEFDDDLFGSAISFSESGQTIAVGAKYDDNSIGMNVGSVKVFRYSSNSYLQLGKTIEGKNQYDNFGTSVALSSDGNTCIVGIPGFNGSRGTSSGAAIVLTLSSNGEWIEKGSLIQGIQGGEKFGTSVDISDDGNVIAIGALLNDNENGNSAGQVRVFKFSNINGNLNWVQLGRAMSGESRGNGFGTALSLSRDGRTVGIGAPLNSVSYYEGHARVFRYTADEEWVQLGTDIDGDIPLGQFGGHISLSKDGNIVGIGMTTGSIHAVKVYELINDEWSLLGSPLDGYSVALSNDGLTAAVGSFTGNGQVLVMKYIDDNWVQLGEPLTGEVRNSFFGKTVAISGDGSIVAAGAPDYLEGHVKIFFNRINSSTTDWLRSGGQPNFSPDSSGTKSTSYVYYTAAMMIFVIFVLY